MCRNNVIVWIDLNYKRRDTGEKDTLCKDVIFSIFPENLKCFQLDGFEIEIDYIYIDLDYNDKVICVSSKEVELTEYQIDTLYKKGWC